MYQLKHHLGIYKESKKKKKNDLLNNRLRPIKAIKKIKSLSSFGDTETLRIKKKKPI